MIVVRQATGTMTLLFLGSVGFAILGALLIFSTDPILRIVGVACVLFFGICGGFILRKLLGHGVAFIIDRRGILDSSPRIPGGCIRWEDITRVDVVMFRNQTFVGIDVRDREALYARSKGSALMKENVTLVGFPVNIPSSYISMSAEELCEIILHYWKEPEARKELGEFSPDR